MNIPHPLRDRMQLRRDLLAAELIHEHGATPAQAAAVLAKIESEHPILDWLIKVDWATLLSLALKFLPLLFRRGRRIRREG